MTADRTLLPEPGTRVRVRYEGEVSTSPGRNVAWVQIGPFMVSLNTPGVTWEPVEPREWADGDVVVCEQVLDLGDVEVSAWRLGAGGRWWNGSEYAEADDMDAWVDDPTNGGWDKVRVVVRGGVDV